MIFLGVLMVGLFLLGISHIDANLRAIIENQKELKQDLEALNRESGVRE